VRNYIQGQLPRCLEISNVESKSFINGDSGAGRTSVNVTLRTTEPLYQQLSRSGFQNELSKYSLTESDLQVFTYKTDLYVKSPSDFFTISVAKGTTFQANAELACNAVVKGWAFNGGIPLTGINGVPLNQIPHGAIVLGSPEEEKYLGWLSKRKQEYSNKKDSFVSWVRSYFAKGKTQEGMHKRRWQESDYPYKFTLTFTKEPIIKVEDFEIHIQAFCSLQWHEQYPIEDAETKAEGITIKNVIVEGDIAYTQDLRGVTINDFIGTLRMTFGPTGREYYYGGAGDPTNIFGEAFDPDPEYSQFRLEPVAKKSSSGKTWE